VGEWGAWLTEELVTVSLSAQVAPNVLQVLCARNKVVVAVVVFACKAAAQNSQELQSAKPLHLLLAKQQHNNNNSNNSNNVTNNKNNNNKNSNRNTHNRTYKLFVISGVFF
jgi:hypothetical protein